MFSTDADHIVKRIISSFFQVALLLFVGTNFLFSQDPIHYKIDDEDGLPSNEVYQVVQDDFGFIWIGCDAGLYRYDGFEFKLYTCENQNSRSVSSLVKDSKGQIWCQNFTGQIFKVQGDSLHVFFENTRTSSLNPIYTIDSKNNIWIATDSQLAVFNDDGKCIKSITSKEIGQKSVVWTEIQSYHGSIVAVDIQSNFFSFSETNYSVKKIYNSNEIGTRHFLFDCQNKLYVFSEPSPTREYFVSSIVGNKVELLANFQPEGVNGRNYFWKSYDNQSFMGTSNGLLYSNTLVANQNNFSHILKGKKIADVFKDREGNFWVSTLQDGIFVIPNLNIKVCNKENSILTDDNVYSVLKVGSDILVGAYSGEVFTLKNEKLSIFAQNSQAKYRAIRKMLVYNGSYLIASGPLRVQNNPLLNELPALNNIRDMIIMDDILYFTSTDRTGYIDLKNPSGKVVISRKKGGKSITCDPHKHIVYVAFIDGLFCYSNSTFTELKINNQSVYGSDIYFNQGKLWVGTMTKGVSVFENSKAVYTINNAQGLQGLNVKCLKLENDFLWISTEKGLNKFNIKTRKNKLFNRFDGLDYVEINDIEILGSTIYLATIRGLVSMPLDMRSENFTPPNIKILGIQKGKSFMKNLEKLVLYNDEEGIRIHFVSTAFRSRGAFVYEYRILNYSGSWIQQNSKSPFVSITALPPGDYTFEVRTVNEDGICSSTASLTITVEAPFYQKWWFYLLISFLAALVVTAIFIIRIRFLTRQASIKNKLIVSQMTALKAQMNPHFMYNTLSSIQDFIWENDTKNSNYYLGKFSMLMRKILDASDTYKISLTEEIEILSLYLELEKLRFGESFSYSIQISNEIRTDNIELPSMILQPFVENAIKHGLLHKNGKKELNISFQLESKMLECTIVDNGIGRDKSNEIKLRQASTHKSFATHATEKRIELLKLYDDKEYKFTITDLFDENGSSGTKVVIHLAI